MQVPLLAEISDQLTELRDAARNSGTWSTADVLTPSVPVAGYVFWYSLGTSVVGQSRITIETPGSVVVPVTFDNPLKPLDYVTADSMLCGYWNRITTSVPDVTAGSADLLATGFALHVTASVAGTVDVYWQVGEYYVRAENQNEE